MTGTTAHTAEVTVPPAAARPPSIERHPRPHSNLLAYYALSSLVLGPFFLMLLIPKFFRYKTLRFDFDDDGVSMRWGILFRREISLTYARIQDIHLSSNLIERWFGLARIQVQTASGSAGAEMTIEGLREYEQVRDFLYSRMRGVSDRGHADPARSAADPSATGTALDGATLEDLVMTLRGVARELSTLRATIEAERSAPEEAPHE